MNMALSPSSVESATGGSAAARNIAIQACDRCRVRKQKCDERKPCSSCVKHNVTCSYQPPQPSKKDRTLEDILKKLSIVENKIDQLSERESPTQAREASFISLRSTKQEPAVDAGVSDQHPPLDGSSTDNPHVFAPSTKVMLEWPEMQPSSHRHGQRNEAIEFRASPFLSPLGSSIGQAEMALHAETLVDASFSTASSTSAPFSYPDPHIASPTLGSVLGWDTISALCMGYFETFNILHPLVDQDWFMQHALTHININDESTPVAALVFLVLALGDVALASGAAPISQVGGRPSGIKGGSTEHPPGFNFFNEARKKIGLFLTDVSVENLQVLSLTALYYATCGRAGDCWRMAATATIICESLATKVHEENASHELIRRLFWHCSSMTSSLRVEFQLPIVDLEHLSDVVGLPSFAGGQTQEQYFANRTSQFEDYSQSQIFMQRMFFDLHASLDHIQATSTPPFVFSATTSTNADTLDQNAQDYSQKLERWRTMLPAAFQWHDTQSVNYDSNAFPTHLLHATMSYSYTDIMTAMQSALLQSQYCHAKYLIHRSYIYKVLHHDSDVLVDQDLRGAAECLRASLGWPITMALSSANKRLIPLPFYWSQNICGVLVLLNLSQKSNMLSKIRTNFCGPDFDMKALQTVELYVHWLRDMRQIDATAERCWRIIQPLYGLEA